jgi:hypothetical protein
LTTPHHLEGEFKNNSLKDLTVGTNLIELQQKNFLLTVIFCFRWIIQDEKKQSIKTNPTGQCDHNLNSDRKQNSWMALVLSTRLRVNLKKSIHMKEFQLKLNLKFKGLMPKVHPTL